MAQQARQGRERNTVFGRGTELQLRERYQYLPKDYVETAGGFVFAVVAEGTEQQRVLASLRYQRRPAGLCKLTTEQASQILHSAAPQLLFDSPSRDVCLPGLPTEAIVVHYRPALRWQEVLSDTRPRMATLPAAACQVANVLSSLAADVGLTGSYLLGAQQTDSDLDVVVYGRRNFRDAQQRLAQAVTTGQVAALTDEQWWVTYQRRGGELEFDEYVAHERRKLNKFSIDGVRVDLSCVCQPHAAATAAGSKVQRYRIRARVVETASAFAFPAVYEVDHPSVRWIVCYSATYIGQAQLNERVEAQGWLERLEGGQQRLVIGASREADGEFLRVVQ